MTFWRRWEQKFRIENKSGDYTALANAFGLYSDATEICWLFTGRYDVSSY